MFAWAPTETSDCMQRAMKRNQSQRQSQRERRMTLTSTSLHLEKCFWGLYTVYTHSLTHTQAQRVPVPLSQARTQTSRRALVHSQPHTHWLLAAAPVVLAVVVVAVVVAASQRFWFRPSLHFVVALPSVAVRCCSPTAARTQHVRARRCDVSVALRVFLLISSVRRQFFPRFFFYCSFCDF